MKPRVRFSARGSTSILDCTSGSCCSTQVPETLSEEVLAKLHAPPKDADVPIIDVAKLPEFDGFIFGFPTRSLLGGGSGVGWLSPPSLITLLPGH